MDLCAASWEVIRMTSRTIRGLVPDLSGDGGHISSSAHFASSHCRPSPTGEATHQWRQGPFGMYGHGQGHDLLYVCMYVCTYAYMYVVIHCVCVCVGVIFLQQTKKDKETTNFLSSLRSHPSALRGLMTLEDRGCCPCGCIQSPWKQHRLPQDWSDSLGVL